MSFDFFLCKQNISSIAVLRIPQTCLMHGGYRESHLWWRLFEVTAPLNLTDYEYSRMNLLLITELKW